MIEREREIVPHPIFVDILHEDFPMRNLCWKYIIVFEIGVSVLLNLVPSTLVCGSFFEKSEKIEHVVEKRETDFRLLVYDVPLV